MAHSLGRRPLTARRNGGYVRDWAVKPDGKPTVDMGWTWERVMHQQQEHQFIDKAVASLQVEARALGAHGVIGIDLEVRLLASGVTPSYPFLEYSVRGTAVGVPGSVPY